jgi:hypothetical protein
MKQHSWKWLIAVVAFVSVSGVVAQTDTVTQYSSEDIVWHIDATIDYAASPAEGANMFLSVDTDADGNIYIANYNNILILDGDTGERIGAIADDTGTIRLYADVAVADDGTVWIADPRTAVYRVDAAGTILSTVVFETSPGFDMTIPGKIEFGPDGNLYVNYAGFRDFGIFFQVFTPEGDYIRSIMAEGGDLYGVKYFTFAPDGTLFFQGAGIGWITEEDDQVVVHKFAADFMAQQAFNIFYGIAIDDEDNVYFGAATIIDGDSDLSIFQLDSEGALIGQYGHGQEQERYGSEFGTDELGFEASLAMAPSGNLIIAHINSAYSQLIKLNVQNGN